MENLDLIIFSAVISVAFIFFIVMTIMEFGKMNDKPFESKKSKSSTEE